MSYRNHKTNCLDDERIYNNSLLIITLFWMSECLPSKARVEMKTSRRSLALIEREASR